MIGNTGQKASKFGTLKIFKIDPKLMTQKLMACIQKQDEISIASEFFYEELPKILNPSGEKQEITNGDLDNMIKMLLPYAVVGNCSYESAKTTLVFAGMMSFLSNNNLITDDVVKEIRSIFNYVALGRLTTYCETYYDSTTGQPKKEMEKLALPPSFFDSLSGNIFQIALSVQKDDMNFQLLNHWCNDYQKLLPAESLDRIQRAINNDFNDEANPPDIENECEQADF